MCMDLGTLGRAVGVVTRVRAGKPRKLDCYFLQSVQTLLALIHLHMRWTPEVLFQAVKRPDHDPGHC